MAKFFKEISGPLSFWCPGCEESHQVDERWTFNDDLDSPTISPSLLVRKNWGPEHEKRVCHSFIREGQIEFLGDCTHKLKDQTVDIPEWAGHY